MYFNKRRFNSIDIGENDYGISGNASPIIQKVFFHKIHEKGPIKTVLPPLVNEIDKFKASTSIY